MKRYTNKPLYKSVFVVLNNQNQTVSKNFHNLTLTQYCTFQKRSRFVQLTTFLGSWRSGFVYIALELKLSTYYSVLFVLSSQHVCNIQVALQKTLSIVKLFCFPLTFIASFCILGSFGILQTLRQTSRTKIWFIRILGTSNPLESIPWLLECHTEVYGCFNDSWINNKLNLYIQLYYIYLIYFNSGSVEFDKAVHLVRILTCLTWWSTH